MDNTITANKKNKFFMFSFVIFALSIFLPIVVYQKLFPMDSPNSNPLWYFIRKDFIAGLCALLGATTILATGHFFFKFSPGILAEISAPTVIFLLFPIVKLGTILVHCKNILNVRLCQTTFESFSAYMQESSDMLLFTLALLGIVIIIQKIFRNTG